MVEASNLGNTKICPRPSPIEKVVFLECDIQPKVGSKIFKFNTVVHNSARLAKLSGILQVPLIAT